VRTDAFAYDLPEQQIAQHPLAERDASRLMVLDRESRSWSHHTFRELPELLQPGDLLVRNDSKVLPARVVGQRRATGGRWEGLFLETDAGGRWLLMTKTRGRPTPGEWIDIVDGFALELIEPVGGGQWRARPNRDEPAFTLLERSGSVPLPPYIRGGQEAPGDRERYQTLYAEAPGSVAAPTAGLHFTERSFADLERRGVEWVDLTLHVGAGTFRPITSERIEDHELHWEHATLSGEAAERLNRARDEGRRIVAVGTTSARVLETAAKPDGRFEPFEGQTSLYLKPGHVFRGLDALVTNFHLPRSSLLVLVAALAGREFVLDAYAEAVRQGYRFYSYGDAMLIR